MASFAKLQKEAEGLGIALNKDKDGSYWGQVLSTRMELGGYDDPETCLEDLKATQELDTLQEVFSYDNDDDKEDWYRVTYLPDNTIFVRETLAEALADAKEHKTTVETPKPAPAPARRMRRSNGAEAIDTTAARAEAEDVEEVKPPPRFEPKTSGPIRSEDSSVRAMPMRESPILDPNLTKVLNAFQTLVSGMAKLAKDLDAVTGDLKSTLLAAELGLEPSETDEPAAESDPVPPPPKRRSSAKRSAA